MQQIIISAAVFMVVMGCGESSTRAVPVPEPQTDSSAAISYFRYIGEIPVPAGFTRVKEGPGSFGSWLRQVPLKKTKTVYLYNGNVKANQLAQCAVIDIATGHKDLQQCADVVMRLRAEYLFAQKKYSEIAFMDYSGKWYRWNNGGDRAAFDKYLQNVFGWCGSASLEKQLKPVDAFAEIQTGDVLVMGGFPGHAVTVIDMAISARGEKIFMLAQGYQPAQDMHVLVNMNEPGISPWYRIPEWEEVYTPEWTFKKTHLRRW